MIDLSLNEHEFLLTDIRFSKRANLLASCHGNFLASIVWRTNPTNRRRAILKEPRTFENLPIEANQMWSVLLVVNFQRKN